MSENFNISTLNKIGERENLEDTISDTALKCNESSAHLFLVCDGVGGLSKGEVASKLACESITEYFQKNVSCVPEDKDIQQAVAHTETAFDKYVLSNSESAGMATTLTLCHLYGTTAMLAHVGDSRIYHIRNGEIIFKTLDHSYVNDLVKSGYITQEAAAVHPKRNVITRAIQTAANEVTVDVNSVQIELNDFLLLCTDGILESIDEDFIRQQFLESNDLEKIVHLIDEKCSIGSTDNYSGIFIQIQGTSISDTKINFFNKIKKALFTE